MSAPTLEDARAAGRGYRDQFGVRAVRALVRTFGVERLGQMSPGMYPLFIAACRDRLRPPAIIPEGVKPTPYLPVDADRFNRLTEYVKAARAKFYPDGRVGLDWGHAEPMAVTTRGMSADDLRDYRYGGESCKHPTLLVVCPMVPGVWVPVEVKK